MAFLDWGGSFSPMPDENNKAEASVHGRVGLEYVVRMVAD
jgi:hypothetical protein